MPKTETFDTAAIETGSRLSYWNSLAKNAFDNMDVEPASRHFVGRMRRRLFGSVQLTTVNSTPVAIQARRSSKLNGIYLMTNEYGSCEIQQYGRRTRLLAGEITVLCAHDPYRIECSREHRTQVLYIPGRDLARSLAPHIAVSHRGDKFQLLNAFISHLDRMGDNDNAGNLLDTAATLLDLTWCSPRTEKAGRATAQAWQERMRRYVEQHLGSPELGAESMAEHFGLSPRYVQMIFAASNVTVGAYILERRLQTVAERLRHDCSGRICDIALEAGFNDLSHFCRCFRDRFGISARDYRKRQCPD
jgi:AraC-like DNA-binding protein